VFVADDVFFENIAKGEGVDQYSLVIEDDVILRHQGQPTVASILGVDSSFSNITKIKEMINSGSYLLEDENRAYAIPGFGVKTELGIADGYQDEYQLISISAPIRGKKLSRFKEKALNTKLIPVAGIFSVNAELDVKYVMTPLWFAQDLLGYESNQISRLDLSIEADQDAEDVKESLQKALGEQFIVKTRYEKNLFIHQTNKTEKWATFMILTFILVIAAFNVMASLTMLIIEKRKDIFILKSMGMTFADIRNIFTFQGISINAIGAIIGVIFGLFLCYLQINFGIIELQNSVVPHYPMAVQTTDLIWVMSTVLIVGTLFSSTMVRYLIKRFAN
ncbi:MAG: ABC transporter permease, partial [Flavobacteriales bacterium]